jgi:hypothetical protein
VVAAAVAVVATIVAVEVVAAIAATVIVTGSRQIGTNIQNGRFR